jgi:ABC-type antimicrobial peptide transport system permease subunit
MDSLDDEMRDHIDRETEEYIARGASPDEARRLARVKPELSVTFLSLSQPIDDSLVQERVMATLAGLFGALAVLLATLGLYGVAAYAVALRRTEIGIRMALGASPMSVVRLALSRVAVLVGLGTASGIALSLWASTTIGALLYGVQPGDPVTLAGPVLLLGAVAAIATSIPADRASRIAPAEVLRDA